MQTSTRRAAVAVAVGALVLGFAGMLLFVGAHGQLLDSCGINVAIWIVLGLIAMRLIARRAGIALDSDGFWLAIPACFFAATYLWREDGFLQFWNTVLMLLSLLLLITRSRGPWRIAVAGYTEYLRLAFLGLLGVIAGPFALGSDLYPKQPQPPPQLPQGAPYPFSPISPIDHPASAGTPSPETPIRQEPSGAARVLPALVKGALLSFVPLGIFGALFANADPVFDHLLSSLFRWNLQEIIDRCIWVLLFGLIAAGVLRASLIKEPPADQPEPGQYSAATRLRRTFKTGDILVALALITLLFAVFVGVQFDFLFGGASVVQSVPGLNYSAYARGGFFQLAWVAGLTLPLLLLSHWFTQGADEAGRRRVKWLTGALTLLLLVIVASAFKRMARYEAMWGLTQKRLLVSVFIGAITLVFLWFLVTVWRGRPRRFAFGLLCASMLTIAGLDVINTDALVVRVDAARAQGLRFFDADYLVDLGPDAVPALAQSVNRLAPDQQPLLAKQLVDGWGKPEASDWRQWNASDAAARQAVAAHRRELDLLGSKAPK